MTELQMMARELGANERTLRRAAHQGTVRAEWVSPRRVRLKHVEKTYLRRNWPLLNALRRLLRTEPNVRLAILFGSAARGEDTTSSDVDLVVSLREAGLARQLELSSRLEVRLGRRVDLTVLPEVESSPALLAELVDEGRVIVDREQYWPRLRAARPDRLARTQRRRAKAALTRIERMLADERTT